MLLTAFSLKATPGPTTLRTTSNTEIHMPDELTPEQTQQITNTLTSGRKLEAIKLYRDATGKGLKDSKDYVEALIPKLIEQDPEKYASLANQGKGCASVIVVALIGTAALLWRAIG
jgi:hypothetical protein